MGVNLNWLEKKFFERELSESEKEILSSLKEYKHRQSERIVEQGRDGGKLYILYAGQVIIEVTKDGTRTTVGDVKEGCVFGEMSFLSGGKTTADVIAKENCVVYVMEKEQFMDIMHSEPKLAFSLFQAILKSESHVISNLNYQLLPFLRVLSEKVKGIPLAIKLFPVAFTIIYTIAFILIQYKDFSYLH